MGERTTGYLWVHLGVPLELVLGAALVTLVMVGLVGGERAHACGGADHGCCLRGNLPLLRVPAMDHRRIQVPVASRYLVAKWVPLHDPPHPAVTQRALGRPGFASADPVGSGLEPDTRHYSAVLVAAVVVSFDVGDLSSRGNATWLQAMDKGRAECLRSSYDTTQVLMEPGYYAAYMDIPCRRLIGARAVAYPSRSINVLDPAENAVLSGTTLLRAHVTDSAHVTTVQFLLVPNVGLPITIANAVRTPRGWTARWLSTKVSNASYALQSGVVYQGGDAEYSSLVPVIVKNRALSVSSG